MGTRALDGRLLPVDGNMPSDGRTDAGSDQTVTTTRVQAWSRVNRNDPKAAPEAIRSHEDGTMTNDHFHRPRLPGLAGTLAALLLLATGCDRPGGTPLQGSAEAKAFRVRIVKPARKEIVRKIHLPATARARFEVTLYAKATGFVKTVLKDRGDRVEKGEVIATLEVPEMNLELEHARASFALEDTTLKRLEGIRKIEKTAVTDQDLDLARAKRAMAEASQKRLQALLDYTEIRAPFSGVVTERFVDPGAFVQQARIVALVDPSVIRVNVDIPESEARYSKVGTEADVQFDALDGAPIHAAISRTATSLDPVARVMRVEIDVPNPDLRILPGMFGHASLGVERKPNVLVVSAKSVVQQRNRSFVFVDAGGTVKKTEVTLGTTDGEWCEACTGLTGDEEVIIPEGQALVDGASVTTGGTP
jgi:RND family efflux transporter MFP subunit